MLNFLPRFKPRGRPHLLSFSLRRRMTSIDRQRGLEALRAGYAGSKLSDGAHPLRRECDERASDCQKEGIGSPASLQPLHEPGASIGTLCKRIQAVNKFLEPLRPSDRGSLNHPVIDLIRVGLGGLSENDLVDHVFFGTRFQTPSVA